MQAMMGLCEAYCRHHHLLRAPWLAADYHSGGYRRNMDLDADAAREFLAELDAALRGESHSPDPWLHQGLSNVG
jgi:hypothetical protein